MLSEASDDTSGATDPDGGSGIEPGGFDVDVSPDSASVMRTLTSSLSVESHHFG